MEATKYGAHPLPVRLAAEDREALEAMAARLGIGMCTTLRVCMRLGLEALGDALKDRRARARELVDRLAPVQPE